MDRIFGEIKRAIEEEMRNAESGPSPGGTRPRGGRRAQEYAEWLKEEQERLRGDQPAPLAEQTISSEDSWEQQARERQAASTQRHQDRRQQRSSERSQTRRQPQQAQRSTSQYQRSEARHQRRADSAYDRRSSGAAVRRRVQRLLSTNQGLRQAFLMREIVGKPLSLRDKDDHLISS